MNRRQMLVGLVVLAIALVGAVAYFVFSGSSDTSLDAGATKYTVAVASDDRAMGNPKAPMQIVEYAAPTCPHCAHFNETMFPALKKDYIDTGKAFYIFRVFPLSQVDVAAESMARCLPADNYFQFIDLLFRNQSKWDPDGYQIPDVHAALVDQGKVAGMSADQVDQCINNADANKRATDVGQDAETKYGIQGTPSFIVNGEIAPPFESFDDVKKYLDQKLAQK
jgi:protein-disulfide isomerase